MLVYDVVVIFLFLFFAHLALMIYTRQWRQGSNPEMNGLSLNLKQKEGFMAITTKTDSILPPVLLIGPFGTGKTLTLAKSVISLLSEPSNRILICTHSNRSVFNITDPLYFGCERVLQNKHPFHLCFIRMTVF